MVHFSKQYLHKKVTVIISLLENDYIPAYVTVPEG